MRRKPSFGGGMSNLGDKPEESSPNKSENQEQQAELPKVGQIFREDSDKFPEPGYFQVTSVENKTIRGKKKTLINIKRIDPETGVLTGRRDQIKEGPVIFAKKYSFFAENDVEFLKLMQAESTEMSEPAPEQQAESISVPEVGTIYADSTNTFNLYKITGFTEENGERYVTAMPYDSLSKWWALTIKRLPLEEFNNFYQLIYQSEEEFQKALAVNNPETKAEDIPTPEPKPASEPEPTPEPAPTAVPPAPEAAPSTEALKEKQKEALEAALVSARSATAQVDYEHSTKTNMLTRLFGLKQDTIPFNQSLESATYAHALKDLRDYELNELQSSLATTPDAQQREKIESFLLRYRYQEAAELYRAGTEAKMAAENETIAGKVKIFVQEIGNGYRHLSWQKKLAIGGALVGVSLAGGSAVAGVAGIAFAAKRIVATTATFLAVDEGANKYFTGKDLKKAKAEIKDIKIEQLLDATNEKLSKIQKDLERLKTRDKKIKLAALAGAIGLPIAAFSFFDALFGSESASTTAGSTEAIQAESHLDAIPNVDAPQEVPLETASPDPLADAAADSVIDPSEPSVPAEPAPESNVAPTAEQIEASGYLNSGTIGFGDGPVSEREQYWRDVQRVQGNAIDPENPPLEPMSYQDSSVQSPLSSETTENVAGVQHAAISENPDQLAESSGVNPEAGLVNDSGAIEFNNSYATANIDSGSGGTPGFTQASYEPTPASALATETLAPNEYTVEMSDYKNLLENPPAGTSVEEVRVAQRESLTMLREATFDIDTTEFGPNHQFTNMNMSAIERQYQGRPMTEIIYFNDDQYADRRPEFRARDLEYRNSRSIYLDPINPYPRLSSGPDVFANATMSEVRDGYRQNLEEMARAARRAFGPAGNPIERVGYRESVKDYMLRITTLYTRARLENPNFKLKF